MTVTSRLTERSWRAPFGKGRLPVWLGLVFFLLMAVAIGLTIGDRRGPVLGVAAFAFYATTFCLVAVAGDRMAGWTERHRFVDSLLLLPFLFFGLLLTPWSAGVCLVITAAFGMPLLVLIAVLRWRS